MKFGLIAFAVFVLNLPFGYWRASERKFSRGWILSVHAPVPVVIALRLLSGMGWQLVTFPIMVGAFFSGQLLGGRIYSWRASRAQAPVSACLIWDMVRSRRSVQKGA